MIKKSKKIIASLLMTLSLISIFPMTNAFAATKEEVDAYVNFLKNDCTPTSDLSVFISKKDGKRYGANYFSNLPINETCGGNYYGKEHGDLAQNEWIYINKLSSWRYYGSDYKCVKGYQTINGLNYYFSYTNGNLEIGWFKTKDDMIKQHENLLISRWHYSYPDGLTREGWIQSGNGNWYYIYADGSMAVNTTTPDGYHVNDRGICK